MVEIFQAKNGLWHFRVKGFNREIMAQSEGYATRSNALRGWHALERLILRQADIAADPDEMESAQRLVVSYVAA